MKILIIFRGENQRYRNAPDQPGYSGIINSTDCVDNWNATLFEDLKNNNIDYDVIFITYQSPILDELISRVKPKDVILDGPGNQIGHLTTACKILENQVSLYDKIVILRFDFQYRLKITEWPKWNCQGNILANRDVGWVNNKCYHDLVFITDVVGASDFIGAVKYATSTGVYHNQIGFYLHQNKLPFEIMYENGYHMIKHPLYALKHFDAEPDLDHPFSGEVITKFE